MGKVNDSMWAELGDDVEDSGDGVLETVLE